jgi:N utilization substance protein A
VAVASRQEGLDPVGATVGQRGARVQAVVAELAGEKIDVIPWNDDPALFVANALSPAQVINVTIDEEHRIANVTVPERMLSLAIGREGQNARLAAKLTGWRIDIRSDVSVAEAARVAAAEAEPLVDVAAATPTGDATGAVAVRPARSKAVSKTKAAAIELPELAVATAVRAQPAPKAKIAAATPVDEAAAVPTAKAKTAGETAVTATKAKTAGAAAARTAKAKTASATAKTTTAGATVAPGKAESPAKSGPAVIETTVPAKKSRARKAAEEVTS